MTQQNQTQDWRIEGDVLLTRDDIAFLIGGNHSVLKLVTGKMKPKPESLDAFRDNIRARHALARSIDVPYLHVIFPDKQSVLSEAFPFSPLHRLGDTYMEHVEPDLRPAVLWPADDLKQEATSPFLPLDTHMTDRGSLAVLGMMLKKVGIKEDDTLARIDGRIIRERRLNGDLGRKFTPPLSHDCVQLDPDWKSEVYRSPGGYNDGMIDILFNKDAPQKKTVLLFGDSFFRMMLMHLSAVFSTVICLRTRFLHREMVTLIQPDVVFTGNAERYLSNVTPDTEANAFMLYPHLRGDADFKIDGDFLAAWHAVTAPGSHRSQVFLSDRGISSSLRASRPWLARMIGRFRRT